MKRLLRVQIMSVCPEIYNNHETPTIKCVSVHKRLTPDFALNSLSPHHDITVGRSSKEWLLLEEIPSQINGTYPCTEKNTPQSVIVRLNKDSVITVVVLFYYFTHKK